MTEPLMHLEGNIHFYKHNIYSHLVLGRFNVQIQSVTFFLG